MTDEFVPAFLLLLLSRDKGTAGQGFFFDPKKRTAGQENFFVPRQRDKGTSRPRLSWDFPRPLETLVWTFLLFLKANWL